MDKLLRLQPVSTEKHMMLLDYIAGFRASYYQAARAGLYVDSKKFTGKHAHIWYRAHQFKCEHTPRCRQVLDYLNIRRHDYLTFAKARANERRKIHFTAFNHAWFKGFVNRGSSPFAYRKIALIPKQLVSIVPPGVPANVTEFSTNGMQPNRLHSTRDNIAEYTSLLSFRLQPRVELLFHLTAVEAHWITSLIDSGRAVTLLERLSGWHLRA